jgi:hypothetical protein
MAERIAPHIELERTKSEVINESHANLGQG